MIEHPLANARIMIAGCGYVGCQLGLQLVEQGASVWGVRRHAENLPASIQPVACDLAKPGGGDSLPQGLTHIVYAASSDSSSEAAYENAYLRGLQRVIQHAQQSCTGLRRLAFVSSTAVYAQNDGSWVDEESATEPSHFTGQITLRAERLVESSSLPHTVFRCSGIYGPGRTRLIDSVKAGTASYHPDFNQYTNRIHRDDVAGALAWMLAADNAQPRYVGVDHQPTKKLDVLTWLAKRVGADPPRPVSEQTGLARRAAGHNKRCSNARLLQDGYRFTHKDYVSGYGEMLATTDEGGRRKQL